MPRALKVYIFGVATLSVLALGAATSAFPPNLRISINFEAQPETFDVVIGIAFWTVLTLVASALPVKLPRGTLQGVAMAPVLAAITLGGPAVGGWVAALGTTEVRELRGRIPWYGSLANHAGFILPAIAAGIAREAVVRFAGRRPEPALIVDFAATMVAAATFFVLNAAMAGTLLALRTNQDVKTVVRVNVRETAPNNLA